MSNEFLWTFEQVCQIVEFVGDRWGDWSLSIAKHQEPFKPYVHFRSQ